jgi:acyl carrier protein
VDKGIIFETIKERLISDFKVARESIELDKHLSDDLDLDSLDMVDLIINLKGHIGDKVSPGLFKNARTVQDIVDLVQPIWK